MMCDKRSVIETLVTIVTWCMGYFIPMFIVRGVAPFGCIKSRITQAIIRVITVGFRGNGKVGPYVIVSVVDLPYVPLTKRAVTLRSPKIDIRTVRLTWREIRTTPGQDGHGACGAQEDDGKPNCKWSHFGLAFFISCSLNSRISLSEAAHPSSVPSENMTPPIRIGECSLRFAKVIDFVSPGLITIKGGLSGENALNMTECFPLSTIWSTEIDITPT